MVATPTPEELARQAKFVFVGRIKKLKAATMAVAPVSDRTAVVTVLKVVHAPPALGHYAGADITVELSKGRQRLKEGQELLFFTVGWLFGDGVAVQSLGEHPADQASAVTTQESAAPADRLGHRELEQRIDSADLAVEGKVTSVRLPAGAPAGAKAVAAATRARPVSEHDPQWREAVVSVDKVHKGTHAGGDVIVRFPASRDVAWFNAPKFEPGQRGVWLLRHGTEGAPETTGKAVAKAMAEVPSDQYFALHPLDFIPARNADQVRAMVRARGQGER